MSEYDDVCNDVVGDLAVVIYHREQEIEKLKQDKARLIEALKYTISIECSACGLQCKQGEKSCQNVVDAEKLLEEMEDDKDE